MRDHGNSCKDVSSCSPFLVLSEGSEVKGGKRKPWHYGHAEGMDSQGILHDMCQPGERLGHPKNVSGMRELSCPCISFQKSCAFGLQSQKMCTAETEKSFCNDLSVKHWAQTDQQREAQRGGELQEKRKARGLR